MAGEGVAGDGVAGEGVVGGVWLEGCAGAVSGYSIPNSGCFNRGRPDTMLCGGIIYLFGCLHVRMCKKCRRR